MGGRIHLVSEPDQGTTISFDLSLATDFSANSRSNQEEAEIKDLLGKTILLVEDNPVSMLVSAQHLKRWNGQVIQAVDGQKAVELYLENKEKIDLVLMDINIPILNGFEAAAEIKKANASVPIIAVTASTEQNETPQASIQAYLIKPFDIHEFYRVVKAYLK